MVTVLSIATYYINTSHTLLWHAMGNHSVVTVFSALAILIGYISAFLCVDTVVALPLDKKQSPTNNSLVVIQQPYDDLAMLPAEI